MSARVGRQDRESSGNSSPVAARPGARSCRVGAWHIPPQQWASSGTCCHGHFRWARAERPDARSRWCVRLCPPERACRIFGLDLRHAFGGLRAGIERLAQESPIVTSDLDILRVGWSSRALLAWNLCLDAVCL